MSKNADTFALFSAWPTFGFFAAHLVTPARLPTENTVRENVRENHKKILLTPMLALLLIPTRTL